jgi:mono/diheme cytochrome c family protein
MLLTTSKGTVRLVEDTPRALEYGPDTYKSFAYRGNCSACHMGDLSGGDKCPALKGKEFWSGWNHTNQGSITVQSHNQHDA